MPKSYEAIYSDGRLLWIGTGPPGRRMKVLVTVLEDVGETDQVQNRILMLERTRGCVAPSRTAAEIDADIRELRNEWSGGWNG